MFKTTKAKVIFVVIFCIICISVTLGLILYKNIEIDEVIFDESNVLVENIEKDVEGINLRGTYNQNDLIIDEKRVSKEKAEIQYYQIEGLKNKTIQDSINKDLERVALNWYKDEIKDFDKAINVSVGMYNFANFANTLSFEIYYVAKIDDDGDGFYKGSKGLNYDLTTGEQIRIDKLFTSDAPIEDILRQSAYYSLIQRNLEDNLAGDLIVSNYGDIEDDIAEVINAYKNDKITKFHFSPKYIYIYYDGENFIGIEMIKHAEFMAIYSRYLTSESIYETNDVGLKNLYTLSERNIVDFRHIIYEKGSNYFIDINLNNYDGEENEFSPDLKKQKIEKIEKEIEKMKNLADKNTDKFYILNYCIEMSTTYEFSIEQNIVHYYEKGNSYEMTIHDFEENIEPIIIEYNRQESPAMLDYVYDFSRVLRIEPQEIKEYYNPETGDKVVV